MEIARLSDIQGEIYAELNGPPPPVAQMPATVFAKSVPAPKRAKRHISAAGRKAIGDAARRRWAKVKKAQKAA